MSLVNPSDLMEVGYKLVALADRVKLVHSLTPGATGEIFLLMDGTRYKIHITIEEEPLHDDG